YRWSMPTLIRPLSERHRRQDMLLAGAMLLGGIISAALSSISQIYGEQQAPLWTALVYVVILCVPLAFRRRWPSVTAIAIAVAYFLAVTFRVPELYVGNFAMFIG